MMRMFVPSTFSSTCHFLMLPNSGHAYSPTMNSWAFFMALRAILSTFSRSQPRRFQRLFIFTYSFASGMYRYLPVDGICLLVSNIIGFFFFQLLSVVLECMDAVKNGPILR